VKRLVQSEGYARARLVNGTLFVVLGSVVIVRTLVAVRFGLQVLPACVLGMAMIALGAVRLRDYFALRAQR
jgi:hypothetical protein